jgi:SNF2 family DNA or RNA helicase
MPELGVATEESGRSPRPAVWHWQSPSPPPVVGADLALTVSPLDKGWQQALAEPLVGEIYTVPVAIRPLQAISVSIPRPAPLLVRSFSFAEPAEAAGAAPPARAGDTGVMASATRAPRSTRIRPPADVIKLEDRLQYLLQPPLESLFRDHSLAMPFQPFPFQLDGVAFLYPRHAAILADEMGLGKTMQAITAIRLLLRRGELKTVLLVCPKPLVTNWQREFQLWAPEVPLLVIEGEQDKRAWQWQLPDAPVRVANYELLVRDRALFESAHFPGFDLVVLDESQRIKNRAGTTNQVARAIRRRRGWALTGTPVENSTDDLVGIFEFLAPGFLSPEMKPRKMGRTAGDYILRRTKEQVLTDLPPKLFRDAQLELTAEQRETYRLAEEEGMLRLSDMGPAATIQHVFELIMRLKQICNFDPVSGASTKLERLEADLEEVADSGRKAIVFSQWVATIETLAGHLRRFGPLQYHGRVPAARRDGILRRFRDDRRSHVLLMSYGAGGVGLNLQFAGYVFLFDRWWNPAVEDQAINRAHRIGAAGPVTVTRMLVLDTIEERIDHILQEKRDLFETIFSEAGRPHRAMLTQEELFGLFRLKCPAGVVNRAA